MKRAAVNVAFALSLGLGLILACLWVLVGGASVVQAQGPDGYKVYYVAPSCVGVPAPCYTIVQDAVDAVDDADDVINVAEGTYTGVDVRPRNDITSTGLVTQVVYISKSVTIRGGYAQTFTELPDPEANPTVLDAERQGRVLYITGDISSTIEGLRITGGDALGLGGSLFGEQYDSGGGVYVYQATVAISGSHIYSNTAGGDIESGGILAEDRGFGGGLYAAYGDDLFLSGNVIYSNTVSGDYGCGAGLIAQSSDRVTVIDNTVFGNQGALGQFGVGACGGGMFVDANPAGCTDATVRHNVISDNRAAGPAGGLGIYCDDSTVSDNVISDNSAGHYGGGLAIDYSNNVTVSNNVIVGNSASVEDEREGGGVYINDSRGIALINNVVADNLLTGGGLGAGIYIRASQCDFRHITIAGNSGGDGSGVYVRGYSYLGEYSTVALTNTILVSHTVGITVTAGNTATLEATLWGSGDWANGADWGGAGTILVGAHNYWGDPALVDPDAGDYHIGPGSVAIDAGVDAGVDDDIDGDPRPVGGGYDIGADERRKPGTLSIYLPVVLKQSP